MGEVSEEQLRDLKALAPRRKFTVSDYHRMADAGIFEPDDRVELIDGELYEMAPIGSRHAGIVATLTRLLSVGVADRGVVFVQNPILIPDISEPQPDLALLAPRGDDYRDALPVPAEVKLVIEVADTTVRWDRDVKIALYGRHGIAEGWLVEIPRRTVTVYREPGPHGYRSSTEIVRGAVSPLCLPQLVLRIDEIFGPA
jgi:Uma2 family endonuclease